jgi:hypothetical protein
MEITSRKSVKYAAAIPSVAERHGVPNHLFIPRQSPGHGAKLSEPMPMGFAMRKFPAPRYRFGWQ